MTKKKRELIEILLDNVNPEDWPEHLPYAAQDKSCSMVYVYANIPDISSIYADRWECGAFSFKGINIQVELCRYWNKTIVHRDEFMKRWNERNGPVELKTLTFSREWIDPVTVTEKMEKISIKPDADSEGWIQWNGGEMPVEKGALIDVKYRDGSMTGEVFYTCDNEFRYSRNWCRLYSEKDIIAYRPHVPQEQKTPQQVALEKFGTDWHENEGVQPIGDEVLIDLIMCNGDEKKKYLANYWAWDKGQVLNIKKWRIHSDQAALLREPMPQCCEEIPCRFVDVKEKKYLDKVDGEFVGIEKVIADRGSNYGRFEDGAEIMQQLKLIAHTSQGWERMKPVQREAMDMILHKVGRILNGDPAYIDSWVDIEGYSNLVSSWLKGESK